MSWNRQLFDKEGFTLIEIIIVITIISIFMGFGTPKLMELFFNSNLKQDVRKTALIIKEARINAILQKSQAKIVFDTGSNTIKYPTSSKEKKENLLKLSNVSMSVKCQSKNAAEADDKANAYSTIDIKPNGMATPCSIKLSDRNTSYTIVVKPFILVPGIEGSG
jgi:prepilin-type N-terminal cleavage/methylation domain-containing protein